MLKKFVISLVCLLLVGCSSETPTNKINITEVATKLYELSDFSGVELSLEQAKGVLFLGDEVVDAKVIIASDNTSDIVALIQSNDVEATMNSLNDYKAQLVNMANAYSPEELEQIDNAYLTNNGEYIIFIISDDYESVINEVNQLFND